MLVKEQYFSYKYFCSKFHLIHQIDQKFRLFILQTCYKL
jgi:hypothetical protein